jgi:microcystin degradation protein MlrC
MARPPIRIAILQFVHETVTFLGSDTTIDDYTWPGSPATGEALLAAEPTSYVGGFVKVAREFDGIELTGIESPLWSKRGTGSGWITQDTYEHFVSRMIDGLRTQGKFDGVYLALHGAMAVRGVARPEAELARRVREVVGPSVPIAATFDPHGNEDDAFLQHADLAFTVKYYPHYDSRLQGERAARTLIRGIRGDYKPTSVTIKVPIISPTVLQWTGASPWMDLVQRALIWEARERDATVNVFFGFPWSDVPDVGMTIQVITNADADLAKRIGNDMAQTAWRQRHALLSSAKVHLIPDGVALAKQAVTAGATPVVLADHSDRSGYATWLLREIIAQDLANTLIATVADADAIAALIARGAAAGDAFDMPIGGRVDISAGEPVRISGTIRRVGPGLRPDQTWVSVAFGRGNLLVISPYLTEITDPAWLHVAPDDFQVIAIKSRVHFRRGFHDNGFAKTILLVEPTEPFLGTVRLDALPYRNVDLRQYYPYGEPRFP